MPLATKFLLIIGDELAGGRRINRRANARVCKTGDRLPVSRHLPPIKVAQDVNLVRGDPICFPIENENFVLIEQRKIDNPLERFAASPARTGHSPEERHFLTNDVRVAQFSREAIGRFDLFLQ